MLDITVIACGVIAGTLIARKIEQRKSKKISEQK